MKSTFLIGVFLLIILNVDAQDKSVIFDILKSSNEVEDVKNKLEKYPDYSVSVSFLNSENDSSDFDKMALNKKVGEIFTSSDDKDFYKVIESDSSISIRVSYMYFDGYKMDKKKIDKLRKELIKKLDNGESFSTLAGEFSMDGNSEKGGDFGWMNASILDKTFATAVLNHKKGDIFEVDVANNNWYYLVLKTFDDKITKTNVVLVIKRSH